MKQNAFLNKKKTEEIKESTVEQAALSLRPHPKKRVTKQGIP